MKSTNATYKTVWHQKDEHHLIMDREGRFFLKIDTKLTSCTNSHQKAFLGNSWKCYISRISKFTKGLRVDLPIHDSVGSRIGNANVSTRLIHAWHMTLRKPEPIFKINMGYEKYVLRAIS